MFHCARSLLPHAALATVLCLAGALTTLLAYPARAQSPPPCPDPTPTAVEVDAVPIVVTSTTADYFVLYASHDVDGTEVEHPVLVKRGKAGTTSLAENVEALPVDRYRVEKYLIADPADVDGDCVDDLTELDNLGIMNPVNPAASIELVDGALAIPDRATFETLATASVKFVLFGMDTDRPSVYFVNTFTHPGHNEFLSSQGIDWDQPGIVTGWITYYENPIASDGSRGVYAYSLTPAPPFSLVDSAYTVLAASVPLFEDDFAYFVSGGRLADYHDELALYKQSRIAFVFLDDILLESRFIALNEAQGYGFLRALTVGERPNPRDVVIYEALPNNLPRVAGIITTVLQTPLSHVNLRAIQDGAPNAFVRDALDDEEIDGLIGSYVRYEVSESGYSIRAATKAEVDAHYEALRPPETQTPERDLSVTEITPLSDIGFDDWDAFGVKAANVAELGKLGFPDGTVPDGFAIPFHFYDAFMKHNGFYTRIVTMLADEAFQNSLAVQETKLKELRDAIEDGQTPTWIVSAIEAMNEGFATGINRRYRSSTNNEDLPGFSGAGLYDSKSQKPSEDEDDLAKSLKEVYASLWNFRAFIERDFHRVDHLSAAMGILVHPSYQDEQVNGVAVSFDPAYGSLGTYYVNSQVGEDLVTNPEAHSTPEEVLLKRDGYTVVETSNQVRRGQLLLSADQIDQLRTSLTAIHNHFAGLYNPAADEPFAMEIEFKITSENILAIKQARPWVFGDDEQDATLSPSPAPTAPSANSTSGGGFGPAPVAPSFVDGFRATRTVAQNASTGDAVGDTVVATHPEDLEIIYSTSGTDSASFTVDETTGQIRVKEEVALELGRTYTVNLTATDSAGFGAIIIVMIEVTEAIHHPYDLNRNGTIGRDEVIRAVGDYFKGAIDKEEVIDLIKLYFTG